jgi:hypothetical protein
VANINLDLIKKIILEKYQNKKFTCGDIIYDISPKYSNSTHGTVRNYLVYLTKQGFLDYKMEIRGTPRFTSKKKGKGAIYSLRK